MGELYKQKYFLTSGVCQIQQLLFNSMKKYQYLQSSTKVSQLEARLNMNSYLSKTSLPTGADAKIFLFLEAHRKIPNRQIHPNLYHWYILMKQFSVRTLEFWQQDSLNLSHEDRLIDEYIQSESNPCPSPQTHKERYPSIKRIDSSDRVESAGTPTKASKKNLNLEVEETSGGTSLKESQSNNTTVKLVQAENCPPVLERARSKADRSNVEIECVMQMQLKAEETTPIREFKERLADEKLKLVSLEGEQKQIRVVFKTDLDQIERLKDRISQWEQISNLQFRKQKKLNCKLEMQSEKLLSPEKSLSNFVN